MITIKEQVMKEINNGLNTRQIMEKFKDYNPVTIKTYISNCKSKKPKLVDISDVNVNIEDNITSKQKNVFIDLENGIPDIEICKRNGINSKTLDSLYKYKYRKIFNLKNERNIDFSSLNYVHELYKLKKEKPEIINVESNNNEVDLPIEQYETLFIGGKDYNIGIYSIDGIIWLNMDELFESLRKEEIEFNINDLVIPEKYISSVIINGKKTNIIDKNILLNMANQIGDHTLINSAIDLIVTNKDIFYKVSKITSAINLIHELIQDYQDVGLSQVEVFETMETDSLHKIENNNKMKDEELLQEIKKLRNIRLKRREFKNIYVLSGKIKYLLASNNSHSNALKDIAKRIQPIANDLYKKIYNNRSELTEKEQEELLNK